MIVKNEVIKMDYKNDVNELLDAFKENKQCEVIYIEKEGRLIGQIKYDKLKKYIEGSIQLDNKAAIEDFADSIESAQFTGFSEEEEDYEIVSKFIAEKDKSSLLILDEAGMPLYLAADESRYQRIENKRKISLRYFDELEIPFESMFAFYLQSKGYKKIGFLLDDMSKLVYSKLNNTDNMTFIEGKDNEENSYDVIVGEACPPFDTKFVSWYDLMVLLYNSKYNVYCKEDNMISEALKKVKAANLCIVRCPSVLELQNRTSRENIIAAHSEQGVEWVNSDDGLEVFRQGLKEYDMEKINQMMSFGFIGNNAGVHNLDIRNDMLNIINGIRLTTDTPFEYTRTIHMFGPSTLFGVGVEDKNTLASFVQRYVNEHFKDKRIRIVNHGVPRADDLDIARLIRNTPIKAADMIVIQYSRLEEHHYFRCTLEKIKYLDAVKVFERPHDMGEIFLDVSHWNYRPNAKLSEYIVKEFLAVCIENDNGLYDDSDKNMVINNAFYEKMLKDKVFMKSLEDLKLQRFDNSKKTGCIIMNANPFTRGHRGLVEMALEHVENLFVFVAQEDRSFFSFKDRFAMVKEGCKDFKNVKVLPTGSVMGSMLTIPAYFQKEQYNHEVKLDFKNETTIMAGFIAPVLNITMRFMGTEPTCAVTRQLEQQTQELLPYYGIQLIIFERLESDAKPISASSVRAFMKGNNKEEIKKIVPITTYNYLLEKGFIK